MKVKFSHKREIFKYKGGKYPKVYCNVKLNRRVRKIERHMRKHHLLFKYEYLQLQNKSVKHIRGDLINFISRKNRWIYTDEYLKIIS